jgi:hypothetical protein
MHMPPSWVKVGRGVARVGQPCRPRKARPLRLVYQTSLTPHKGRRYCQGRGPHPSVCLCIHLFICSSIRLSIHETATTGITVLGGPTTNVSQPPRRTRRRRAADHTRRAGDCEMWLSLTGPATMDHACHSRSRSPEGAGARVGGVRTFREPLGVPAYAPCCASPTPCLLVHVPCLEVSTCSTLSPPRCG